METSLIFEQIYKQLETLADSYLNCGCVGERHGILDAILEIKKIENECKSKN